MGSIMIENELLNHFLIVKKRNIMVRKYIKLRLVKQKCGMLYFKGRVDNQIKHMGYRIELEEIEEGLNNIKEVEQAEDI